MQGSRSSGLTLAMVGIVAIIVALALWLITDTLYQIGIIFGGGMFVGGLALVILDKRKAS